MIAAIVILFAICFLLALAVVALGLYCNHIARRHNTLSKAFVDYADGVTKVFASLRVISAREVEPGQGVYTVETPKGIQ